MAGYTRDKIDKKVNSSHDVIHESRNATIMGARLSGIRTLNMVVPNDAPSTLA